MSLLIYISRKFTADISVTLYFSKLESLSFDLVEKCNNLLFSIQTFSTLLPRNGTVNVVRQKKHEKPFS